MRSTRLWPVGETRGKVSQAPPPGACMCARLRLRLLVFTPRPQCAFALEAAGNRGTASCGSRLAVRMRLMTRPRWHVTESGGLVGAVVSDRYMDQLASMKPFEEQQGKKFSLGCMLVERKGTDDEGNERGVLVTTQVDPPGTLGMAGVEKGDAVLALNGVDVENYDDLRKAMAKIHAAGHMTVEVVIQRQAVGAPELLTVTS